MTVLGIEQAGRVFGSGPTRVVALDNVSLQVSAGEFVAVMGPSGSGKSTLLRLAGGLDRPTSGRVLLAGRDIAGLDEAGLALIRRREVGFVFQEANLFASLTAAENVALALELDGVKPKAAMTGARVLLGWLVYEGLLALLAHNAGITLPQEFPPVIPLITLAGVLVLTAVVIRGPLRRATRIQPGAALRYQ